MWVFLDISIIILGVTKKNILTKIDLIPNFELGYIVKLYWNRTWNWIHFDKYDNVEAD